MNKRSAIALAGGVTGALVSGVVGYAAKLPVPAAGAEPARPAVRPAVQIRTVTTTVRIKKKARRHPAVAHVSGSGSAPVVVSVPAASSTTSPPVAHTGGSSSGGGDDGKEHEGGDD